MVTVHSHAAATGFKDHATLRDLAREYIRCCIDKAKMNVDMLACMLFCLAVYDHIIWYTAYIYIYIPATSTCAIFLPLSKEYKISAKIKNAPGSFLEQEKCPWKIIPESYLSSFIPSCDSNATTVGYCLCLLVAPNQRLKSLHDMPVWNEQVARME